MRIFLSVFLVTMGALPAKVGSITGVVPLPESKSESIPVREYRGKISGEVGSAPVQIAAVWLEGASLAAPSKPRAVTLSQKNYQFAKSLMVIPKGTTVYFPNKDPDYHNIYSLSKTKRFDLGRYKLGEDPAPSVFFDKPGFVALRCEIHEHMNADIVVVDSPYYVTTDTAGRFKLKGVPPGSYTLRAQIDRKTSWKIPVEVRAKKTSRVQFPKK